jgi:hypothetical protein
MPGVSSCITACGSLVEPPLRKLRRPEIRDGFRNRPADWASTDVDHRLKQWLDDSFRHEVFFIIYYHVWFMRHISYEKCSPRGCTLYWPSCRRWNELLQSMLQHNLRNCSSHVLLFKTGSSYFCVAAQSPLYTMGNCSSHVLLFKTGSSSFCVAAQSPLYTMGNCSSHVLLFKTGSSYFCVAAQSPL